MTVQQITPHFKDYEFACKDGTLVPRELRSNMMRLAENLEVIRRELAEPVYINSAYRTVPHNMAVGGAARSYHLRCMAADIHCKGATPQQVFNTILHLMANGKIEQGGLKCYKSFVHYDIRGTKTLFK